MDDKDNDDNTYRRDRTITILKPRLSLQFILAYNCKGDILQLEEDIKGSMCSVCFANLNMYMGKLR